VFLISNNHIAAMDSEIEWRTFMNNVRLVDDYHPFFDEWCVDKKEIVDRETLAGSGEMYEGWTVFKFQDTECFFVREVEPPTCPNCKVVTGSTMSCDQCGESHCDACMGTDHLDRTLCLKCATVIDTAWGKFKRV
jgi:hypothetical protein